MMQPHPCELHTPEQKPGARLSLRTGSPLHLSWAGFQKQSATLSSGKEPYLWGRGVDSHRAQDWLRKAKVRERNPWLTRPVSYPAVHEELQASRLASAQLHTFPSSTFHCCLTLPPCRPGVAAAGVARLCSHSFTDGKKKEKRRKLCVNFPFWL